MLGKYFFPQLHLQPSLTFSAQVECGVREACLTNQPKYEYYCLWSHVSWWLFLSPWLDWELEDGEAHLCVCRERVFSEKVTWEAKPILSVNGTIPCAGAWTEWKGKKKASRGLAPPLFCLLGHWDGSSPYHRRSCSACLPSRGGPRLSKLWVTSKLSSCRFCCVFRHRYKTNGCSHAYRCGAPDTSQQSQGFIFYVYTRVLMSLYAPKACGCPWRSEGVKSGVPGSSELTDMNAGNWSQNFCKSSMPSVQLGHLSIPEPTLFYFCFDN